MNHRTNTEIWQDACINTAWGRFLAALFERALERTRHEPFYVYCPRRRCLLRNGCLVCTNGAAVLVSALAQIEPPSCRACGRPAYAGSEAPHGRIDRICGLIGRVRTRLRRFVRRKR